MKQTVKIIFGINCIALFRLLCCKPALFVSGCRAAFGAARGATAIPNIALGDILGNRKPVIKLSVMRQEDGMLPNDQLMALLSILVAEAPDEILEIGTFMGRTTRQMAENMPQSVIHTVDLPEDFSEDEDKDITIPKDDFHLIRRRTVGREFRGHECESRIKQHYADTARWDFRQAGSSAFFFIDGSHTYEYCKNDSEKCWELCGGRGVFLWHDCDNVHPGVIRLIAEWRHLGRDIRLVNGTALAYLKSGLL